MKILAIDPGTERSAWLIYDSDKEIIEQKGIYKNDEILLLPQRYCYDELVIEMVACYGMPVGKTVFETCVWIGRFYEGLRQYYCHLVYRKDVKMYLCNSMRAKDSNIRQALIDRFGPGREKAIGTKRTPGPLYGIKKDIWSALALAVTYASKYEELNEALNE